MFSVHCPRHDAEVLLSDRNILGLRNTDEGIELHWRCHCGHVGSTLTGRPPLRRSAAV